MVRSGSPFRYFGPFRSIPVNERTAEEVLDFTLNFLRCSSKQISAKLEIVAVTEPEVGTDPGLPQS